MIGMQLRFPKRFLSDVATHARADTVKLSNAIRGKDGRLWEPVIGLEVHAQIDSRSKLFSNAKAGGRGAHGPNSNVSVIDAAIPGTLPSANAECIKSAVKTALSLSSQIQRVSSFDRKHYFYADLPAGYQITQHHAPIAVGGFLDLIELDGMPSRKRVHIHQIQLEQDSGKIVKGFQGESLVDLNRAGVGVLEIVTKPDIRSGIEAVIFMKKMQRLLWYIGASSPDMDEVARQIELIESGQEVQQETRGMDDKTRTTYKLRSKEDAPDYRYMPEPDLPQLILDESYIHDIQVTLPESLDRRRERLMRDYGMSEYNVGVLMDEPKAVEYFEELAKGRDAAKALNWLTTNIFGWLKARNLKLVSCPVSPKRVGNLIDLIENNLLSALRGKNVLTLMMDGDTRTPEEIAKENEWIQDNSDTLISTLLDDLIERNQSIVKEILKGKYRKLKFFSGEVMRITKGKANPVLVDTLLKEKIGYTDSADGKGRK
ncbi:hypothetical protein HDV05_003249 [Chytridiales sp. JEL 0842]|nr:hypothetical protein HDV05_003249 [Chytridiales sp. JEL 0842]